MACENRGLFPTHAACPLGASCCSYPHCLPSGLQADGCPSGSFLVRENRKHGRPDAGYRSFPMNAVGHFCSHSVWPRLPMRWGGKYLRWILTACHTSAISFSPVSCPAVPRHSSHFLTFTSSAVVLPTLQVELFHCSVFLEHRDKPH